MARKASAPKMAKVSDGTLQLAYALAMRVIANDETDRLQMAESLRKAILTIWEQDA